MREQGTDAVDRQWPVSSGASLSSRFNLPDLAEHADDGQILAALAILDNLLSSLRSHKDLLIQRSSLPPDCAIERKKQLLMENSGVDIAVRNVNEEQALHMSRALRRLLADKAICMNGKCLRRF